MKGRLTISLTIICVLLALSALFVFAQDEADPDARETKSRLDIKKVTYLYQSSELRDPFLSIIEEAKRAQAKGAMEGAAPTESYDLSQMRLIAIVKEPRKAYALVGLPDGKFYTIVEGVPLGIHAGVVHQIQLGYIVVREQIRDMKGNLKPQDIELRLRAQEDK